MEEATLKWIIDGMMDDKMYYNPRRILDKLVRTEEAEIPLYHELAKGAPSECLRKTIEHLARREKEGVEQLRMLYHHFPSYHGTEENIQEATEAISTYGDWSEGVKKARDIEVRQCYWLCHLAMYAPDPHVHMMILDLAKEEIQQAMFWNNIYCACTRMSPYPDPWQPHPGYPDKYPRPGCPDGYPGPDCSDPGYPGPGYHPGYPDPYDSGPGVYSTKDEDKEKKKKGEKPSKG
ncbi:MAG: hypothetical protein IMW96_10155 [Thermoanaerobacteraceae bacterium]|nr:hypothetical protein [Thermoanaerobacteraceae bacterium]